MAAGSADIVFDNAKVKRALESLVLRNKQIAERDERVIGILSAIVFRDVIEHFRRQEGPEDKWKDWSPRYSAFMASIGRSGNKLLQFSGRLRNSFQPTNVRKVSEGILWFNNAKTAKGFPYAAAHDQGGPKLPQRQFMWLSEKATNDIEEQILRFLEDAFE